jgi:hypothetical protein
MPYDFDQMISMSHFDGAIIRTIIHHDDFYASDLRGLLY